jgi:DNA-3-methyladenine glycosylase
MYGKGGYSYIYFIYGMYHCFNIVTEKAGFPAAVLIRGVEPVEGIEIMRANSPDGTRLLTDGPGKFCRAFGLTREQNGLDLTGGGLYLLDRGKGNLDVRVSRRIGIKKGADKPWRFFDVKSHFVSR